MDGGVEMPSRKGGSVLNRVANRRNLKSVGKSTQRRQMTRFPQRSNADDADPDFHILGELSVKTALDGTFISR